VFSGKIYKIFTNYEPVGSIQTSDIIVVYQLPGEVPILGKRRKTITIDADGTRTEEDMTLNQEELVVMPVYCAVSEDKDSESNRLLKRAEFLKAVCDKEGVEWLPSPKRFHELDSNERTAAREAMVKEPTKQEDGHDHSIDVPGAHWCPKCIKWPDKPKNDCYCSEK